MMLKTTLSLLCIATPALLVVFRGAALQDPVLKDARPAKAVQHDKMNAVLWMQHSAEYRACCLQTFGSARQVVVGAIRDKGWTACLEQNGQEGIEKLPPAIITDVDETVLDNTAFNARLIADGGEFTPEVWAKWAKEEQALPVPGALGFLAAMHAMGVRVIYITNRKAGDEEIATRRNLKRLGFPLVEGEGEDLVLTEGEIGDKSERRKKVCKSYRILAMIGDNFGDFMPFPKPRKDTGQGDAVEGRVTQMMRQARVQEYAPLWGRQWFMLPNPLYGSWESVLRAQSKDRMKLLRQQRNGR